MGARAVERRKDVAHGTMEQAIEKLLLSVNRPGDFCAHGRLLAPMPRLAVKGAGALSFPVPEAQVQALTRGRGTRAVRQGGRQRWSTRQCATAGR